MIYKINNKNCINTQYFGKDANDFLEDINYHTEIEYLNRECKVGNDDGIIIGVEDNEQFNDYYFIIYIPSNEEITFKLVNNPLFTNTIK